MKYEKWVVEGCHYCHNNTPEKQDDGGYVMRCDLTKQIICNDGFWDKDDLWFHEDCPLEEY